MMLEIMGKGRIAG